jgi:hypothetical protein
MSTEPHCEDIAFEISVAHDEGRSPDESALSHLETCADCSAFATRIGSLDRLLAPQAFDRAPDTASVVMQRLARPETTWWSVAAAVVIGLLVGGLIGGIGTRLDTVHASDLNDLFHHAGTGLEGLGADLLIVERGTHPSVPERVYLGSISYTAPEQLAIDLVDTTVYPDEHWPGNDVSLTIADGDMVIVAASPCPVAAQPECLLDPTTHALRDQSPFDEGVLIPLEIVSPVRTLSMPGGLEVLGMTELGGRPAIQVTSTVAAVELISSITARGTWRDLHPTDPVVMWLDEETLVPLRIEVFPADSVERDLWQLRRGYHDAPATDQPIFIVELANLSTGPHRVQATVPFDAPSRGFVDGEVGLAEPDLPEGFEPHRRGHRSLTDGGLVEVASWSDGRSWLKVEATRDWDGLSLFGLSSPFVETVALGSGSLGYLSPGGNTLAIHGADMDVAVTGSVPRELLIEIASSLGIHGRAVPPTWLQASIIGMDDLPPGTLVPAAEGWSILGRVENGRTTILLTGGGARNVVVTQQTGVRLAPPTGPDFYEVEVRGAIGRYDANAGTLEWIEDDQLIRLTSDTVEMTVLVEVAATMDPR